MANAYTLGTQVTLTAKFTDSTGAAADPTAVTAKIFLPDFTTVTLTPLVNPTVGTYTFAYTPLLEGIYNYQFAGTGALVVAGENTFIIQTIFNT